MKSSTAIAKPVLTIQSQFIAEVEFGMPSKQCRNFGICRIHPVGAFHDVCITCKATAVAVVTVYGNEYTEFDFLRHSIAETTYQKYFSTGKFKVQEVHTFNFSEPTIHEFTLKSGEYPIVESNSILKVICC